MTGGSAHVPQPRQVPGYAEARAAGTLPPVPEHPPGLTVHPTARGMMHRLVAVAFPGAAVLGAGAHQLERLDLPGPVPFLLLGLSTLGLLLALLRMLSAVGRQSLAELAHGYTTLVLRFGGFWGGEGPVNRAGDVQPDWDYRGTWHLGHRDGHVVRAPDRRVDPPGMYPSPHRPERTELWTGAAWLGHYGD